MSRLSGLSWMTSAGVHVTVFAVLGTLLNVAPVDQPTVAGHQSVISSNFSAPLSSAVEPQAVVIETPVEPPDPIDESAELAPKLGIAESIRDAIKSLPPLDLSAMQKPRGLSALPRSASQLVRREIVAVAASTQAMQEITKPAASQVKRTPVQSALRLSEPQQRKPLAAGDPLPRSRPPSPEMQHELVEDVAALTPPASAQPVGTTETQAASPLENPSPLYPVDAVRRKLQGVVMLRVTIGTDGYVKAVKVADSSGYRILDTAALDAVGEWEFHPALRNGQPVVWTARLPIRFRLK